jgi:iron complex outermembrane receptor protein
MKFRNHFRSMLLATASLMVAAPAMAQQAAAAPAAQPAAGDVNRLGEIIVTARRVKENLQSVPVSATAFSATSLRQANISDPQDLTQVTPGAWLSSAGAPSNSVYSIRGQSQPVQGGSPTDAGVVTYLNDVPLTHFLSSMPQFDMSSIQVLKGPQGTLFGRNTTGGAVLLYTAPPTDTFGGYVQGTYGNYDTRQLEGAINLPIIEDKVALRLAGRLDRQDGTVKNFGVGGDLNNADDDNFRASLLLQPTSWLTNTTTYDVGYAPYNHNTGAAQTLISTTLPISPLPPGTPGFPLGYPGLAVVAPGLSQALNTYNAKGPWYTDSDFPTHIGYRSTGVSNKTVIDLPKDIPGDLSLVNIFGYRKISFEANTNFDGSVGSYYDSYDTQNLNQYTDEVQLHGKAFDGKLTWLAGAFTMDSEPDGPTGGQGNNQALYALESPPGSPPVPAFQFPMSYVFYSDRSIAGFFNLNYDLSDFVHGLKFNAGYRYSWDKYSACSGDQNPPNPLGAVVNMSPGNYQITPSQCATQAAYYAANPGSLNPFAASGLIGPTETHGHSSAPTWTVGLDWQADRNLFLYVTARQGYRAGGLNTPTLGPVFVADGLQTYAPEKIQDEEIGVKSDFHLGDWSTRLDVDVFHSDTTHEQVVGTGIQQIAPGMWIDGDSNPYNNPESTVLIVNGQETKLLGLEASMILSPFHGLVADFGGSVLQSTVSSHFPAIVAGYFVSGALLDTPKETFTADVHYTLPLDPAYGEVVYSANFYYSALVDLGGVIAPSYTLTNMRLDWNNVFQKSVDLSFYVKNLFNKAYISGSAFTSPPTESPIESVQFGNPRMFAMQLRYHFGQ